MKWNKHTPHIHTFIATLERLEPPPSLCNQRQGVEHAIPMSTLVLDLAPDCSGGSRGGKPVLHAYMNDHTYVTDSDPILVEVEDRIDV